MPNGKEQERRPSMTFTLESAFRSVKPSAYPGDIEALIRDAKDEKVERTMRKLDEA